MRLLTGMYRKYKEIINYLIVGVLTTIINLIVYYGLVVFILDPGSAVQLQAANVISWIAAVAFAYVTNRRYVFESKSKNYKREIITFLGARFFTLLLDMFCMFAMVTVRGLNDKAAKLISLVIVIVSNYFLSKFLVFNNSEKDG